MKFQDFLTNKPALKPLPWRDPDFSKRSLRLHLDQQNDVNSRRQFIIEKQVNWFHASILKGKRSKLLDLACGPGFYCNALAKFGHYCSGVDISPAAIDYAKNNAHKNCTFIRSDILNFAPDDKFDLILLNFGWFHNFSIPDANHLLKNIRKMLKPSGKLLLELIHYEKIIEYGEAAPQWHKTDSGIFSDAPYLYLQENSWNEELQVAELTYYIIHENLETEGFLQSYQAYQEEVLARLLHQAGFDDFEYFSGLCEDDDFDDELYFLLSR